MTRVLRWFFRRPESRPEPEHIDYIDRAGVRRVVLMVTTEEVGR